MVVSGGVTPGPFPNPEAKPTCADGTAPGRVWESKSPPALKLKINEVWVVVAFQRLQQPTPRFCMSERPSAGARGVNKQKQQHCATAFLVTRIDKV